MPLPFYDKESRIFISEYPSFPPEQEIKNRQYEHTDYMTLYEWETYYVKCYSDTLPESFDKSPFVTKQFKDFYEINFKNYVGLARIGNIKLKIQNKKINDVLFDSMLAYITKKYANLVFSFDKSPVGLEYKKEGLGEDIGYVQYLFLKAYLFDERPNIDEIAGLILAEPHRNICLEKQASQINDADNIDMAMLMNILSQPSGMALLSTGHPLLSTALGKALYKNTGRSLFPAETSRYRKYYTVDTNENRFLLFFLKKIIQTLEAFQHPLGDRTGTYLNPDILENIKKIKQKVSYFLADPLWNEIGNMTFIPAQSTVLQRRDGYRQLFRLYSLMQLSTRYEFLMKDFKKIIENKDMATLFEYWCFFLVKDLLDRKYRAVKYSVIVPHHTIEQRVQEGLIIKYENNIELAYNCTAESYSHSMRPDIVLVKNGKTKIILDAKYKGKAGSGEFYGNEDEGEIKSCKEEDLDKMHAYRDAIKDVVGAFALYPGNELKLCPSHSSSGKFFHGVGALPLRPAPAGMPEQKHQDQLQNLIDAFIAAE